MHFSWLSWNWNLKLYLGIHLVDKAYMYIFPGFQAILDIDQNSSNQGLKHCIIFNFSKFNFKVDLDTHFKYRHWHLFLWDLELFLPLIKGGQTKVENMHFCQLFQNWNLKVDLGTHFKKQAYTPTFVLICPFGR